MENTPSPARPLFLVADDEAHIAHAVSKAFSQAGYAVTAAFDGQQAMDLLDAGLRPDLIITDVMMPRKDGFHILTHAREALKIEVPFLMLNAKSPDSVAFAEWQRSNDGRNGVWYIIKPVQMDELLVKVHRLLP